MQMILEEWLGDIPQQFLGKKNTEVLIRAFSRQMQELVQVFDDLDTKLDLDMAEGQNLDYIGTIVSLSRKEAGILAGIDVKEPVISDDRYRQFLKYKVLKNTNNCTYEDIMQSIEILWRTDNIRYIEDPERPATILIKLQTMSVDVEIDPLVGKVMAIKPAGVALIYTINYTVVVYFCQVEQFFLRQIDLHYIIPFWRTRCFDGSEIMDGSHLMDARRTYDLRIGAKYEMGGIAIKESFGNVIIRSTHNAAYFDGSLLMDGSHLMDAIDREETI